MNAIGRKVSFLCGVLLLLIILLLCPLVYGQQHESAAAVNRTERAVSIHAGIVIDVTGVIRVTETMKVFAAGDVFKRGITWEIPLSRTDSHGKRKKTPVNIISIQRDGMPERYKTEDGVIYIGRADVFLEPGIYEYVIVYESTGQIGFFDEYDELYWNVTGNWPVSIEKAAAAITLPHDAQSLTAACYTGISGSAEMNCSYKAAGNKVHFETGRMLAPDEEFTVALSFPRDIISRPPPPTQLALFWQEYRHPASASSCLLVFLFFFYFTWSKVGKSPPRPAVIPLLKPPHDRSPAATRYLFKRNGDNKAFAAALVSMAVKKALRISNTGKQFSLEPLGKKENMSDEENAIYDVLFANNQSIAVSDRHYTKFADADYKMRKSLEENWNLEYYFLNNYRYIGFGCVLAPALTMLYVALVEDFNVPLAVVSTVLTFASLCMLMAKQKPASGCMDVLFKFALLFIFMFAFFTMAIPPLMIICAEGTMICRGLLLALIILCALYIYAIRTHTILGAQTASELEGFRMYLKTAEERRLNLFTPPRTPEVFEKLLPYAIALGVDNKWGKKFTDILKAANYNPDWYRSDKPHNFSKFPGRFMSSVGGAQSRSTRSSSSSSGSRGGGSAGGGGGGGRRGGW
jgi:uncharacterized membrane protein YgcG